MRLVDDDELPLELFEGGLLDDYALERGDAHVPVPRQHLIGYYVGLLIG